MDGPAERLRLARERAGFETAKEAALSMGVPVSTYIGHENGSRGYSAKSAARYARRLKVAEEWLLYGKGGGPVGAPSATAEVIDIWQHIPSDRRDEALGILKLLAGKTEAADG